MDDHWELPLQRAQLKIDVQSDETVWTPARQELWRRVELHDFEPNMALNFTRRLARDHGWSLDDARAAVDAYRRFCFLAIVSTTPVTPSEVVGGGCGGGCGGGEDAADAVERGNPDGSSFAMQRFARPRSRDPAAL
jgi:hypothetical protein